MVKMHSREMNLLSKFLLHLLRFDFLAGFFVSRFAEPEDIQLSLLLWFPAKSPFSCGVPKVEPVDVLSDHEGCHRLGRPLIRHSRRKLGVHRLGTALSALVTDNENEPETQNRIQYFS